MLHPKVFQARRQYSRWWAFGLAAGCLLSPLTFAADGASVLTGADAFTNFKKETPGTIRKITVGDLPKPFATKSAGNGPKVVPRPEGAWPQVPPGFKIALFATDLGNPRALRTAPNGDLFLADTHGGEIKILRGITPAGKPKQTSTFATGLEGPFGIAFYPLGSNPRYVYVANINSVVRFPYQNGDLQAKGESQTLITGIPAGGHSTRDIAFSPDGSRLFLSVGSASNIDDPDTHPSELHRANILEYTPEGKFVKVYASGIRNPVGITIQPETGQLWCSVNERDMLGDNLVPDYITHVQEGGFYGWPFYYMGSNPDPRLDGKHPEMKGKVIVPDVLLQPHNASLEMVFYESDALGASYKGSIFAAEHGSWNKAERAGYEVIYVPVRDGKATGEYEDFVTGFVTPDGDVWGRPVGVAVAPDGSLMISDDGSASIWRVTRVQ